MLEKIKAIWIKVKMWFISIWNKLVRFFKKQEEIPVVVEPIKPVVDESVKPVQTKKTK